MTTETITQKELKEIIHYDPVTGAMSWRSTDRRLGWVCPNRGYKLVQIRGRAYRQHRLAFLYMKGRYPVQIDHVNHETGDNRWANLREAPQEENNRNASRRKDNSSGITGVMRGTRNTRKWRARIHVKGKDTRLGLYDDFFEACCARKSAENLHKFHENHGQQQIYI